MKLQERVTSRLPHDNPYWLRRHPRQAGHEPRAGRHAAGALATADEQSAEGPSPTPPPPLASGPS
ncbi:hypothetical protein [Streptomyces sp. NPDC058620]|uniref:hypothetical protein n=1 Tax=Streptomyces sp. NPDC058620 TaxID=3346560 RepID=UPI00364D217D